MRSSPYLLSAFLLCSAADVHPQACGTPPPTPEQYAFTRDVVSRIDVTQLRNDGTTCVPLQAHIVRDGAGAGGPSILALNTGLSYLNQQYLPAGIEFYWKGQPDYMNNADYYTFDQTSPDNDTETALVGLFTTATNAVNVYFVNYIRTSSGFEAGGYAYFPANTASSNRMVIRTDQLLFGPTSVFAHEMGHYFNLFHTFEGTSAGPGTANAENVPRTGVQANCSSRGDLLCDTHADPNAGPLNGCTWTGTLTDINGVLYTPPIENPMSYWPSSCGTTFTPQQFTRIMQGRATRAGHTTYTLDAPPQSVTPASSLAATLNANVVQLTWTDNAANDMGYLIERSTTSASAGFKAIAGGATTTSGTSWTDLGIQSNTTYWYRVKPSNGACNTYSNVATISLGTVYCPPTYYETCADGANATIGRVRIVGATTLDNNNSGCSPNGFGDFTAMSANVTAGSTYAVTVSARVLPPPDNTYVPQYCRIWMDTDHDGDFSGSGELLLASPGAMGPTFDGTITVPANCVNGPTRVRVRSWDQSNDCDPDACSFCLGFGETEEYTLNVSGGVSPTVQLAVSMLLQGPYAAGTMTDGLRAASLVPATEPYTAAGYAHVGGGGGETAAAGVLTTGGATAVVDWVVVELRNSAAPATVVASKSALVRRNGTVVSAAGTTPLTFNVPGGSYYVAVRHRNHLGVMTASAIALGASATTVDFTSAATSTYGTNARSSSTEGLQLLWCGNVVGDARIAYTGASNDRDPILVRVGGSLPTATVSGGYWLEDVNMDGTVKYTGADNDRDRILQSVGGSIPTATRQQQLP
ncbi:MAG: hypothetical protein JST66_00595 [Bacteroidetes bacterium]|nr:hypothetical protein [Bacteroidota bacterium]